MRDSHDVATHPRMERIYALIQALAPKIVRRVVRRVATVYDYSSLVDEVIQITAMRMLTANLPITEADLLRFCRRALKNNTLQAGYKIRRHPVPADDLIAERRDTRPVLSDQVARNELFAKAFQTLSARDKTVLYLYVEGYTLQESAAAMGCSVQSVARRRHAARRKLAVWAGTA